MFFNGSAFDGMLELGPQAALPSLSGDFYREADDVTRGLSLYSGASNYSQMQDFMHYGKACIGESETLWSPLLQKCRSELPISRFEEGDEAWQVPEDEFFQLEVTTIVVNSTSAALVGNRMLDFLGTQATCLITKVNRMKFTVKAEVCLDGLNCTTKVRIYKQAPGQYIVEMQRRSGDSIAFSRLYRQASYHLTSCRNSQDGNFLTGPDHCTGAVDKAPAIPVPDLGTEALDASLAPLFDLLESAGNLKLQAEAVQSLVEAAKDINLVVQLFTPQAFVAFRNLLQLVCFSIVEPLAHLLCHLALLARADDNFFDQHLLQAMTEKVWAKETGQRASEHLARSVQHTMSQRVGELPQKANRDLTSALNERLRVGAPYLPIDTSSPHDLATVNYLQESLQMLRFSTCLQLECY
jgi:hypothetical protein